MVRLNTIGVLAMLAACVASCQASGLDDPKVMEHFGNKKGELNDAIVEHVKKEVESMEAVTNGTVGADSCSGWCGVWWHCQPGCKCGRFSPLRCGKA